MKLNKLNKLQKYMSKPEKQELQIALYMRILTADP